MFALNFISPLPARPCHHQPATPQPLRPLGAEGVQDMEGAQPEARETARGKTIKSSLVTWPHAHKPTTTHTHRSTKPPTRSHSAHVEANCLSVNINCTCTCADTRSRYRYISKWETKYRYRYKFERHCGRDTDANNDLGCEELFVGWDYVNLF